MGLRKAFKLPEAEKKRKKLKITFIANAFTLNCTLCRWSLAR